jgi:hypothetical protein
MKTAIVTGSAILRTTRLRKPPTIIPIKNTMVASWCRDNSHFKKFDMTKKLKSAPPLKTTITGILREMTADKRYSYCAKMVNTYAPEIPGRTIAETAKNPEKKIQGNE